MSVRVACDDHTPCSWPPYCTDKCKRVELEQKISVYTHRPGCWDDGFLHYQCALDEIHRLQIENENLKKVRIESSETTTETHLP